MIPDDWCHATTHGTAHAYNGGCRCAAARAANAAHSRRQRPGSEPIVDGLGTRRRLQALARAGWSTRDLARRAGCGKTMIERWRRCDVVRSSSAALIAELFDDLCDVRGPTPQTAQYAELMGWPYPEQWPDPDDPNADPVTAYPLCQRCRRQMVGWRVDVGPGQVRYGAHERCSTCASLSYRSSTDVDPDLLENVEQFPIEPLLRLLIETLENDGSTIWRLYHRARARGHCSAVTADKLAIGLLGLHPSLVWGDDWWIREAAA